MTINDLEANRPVLKKAQSAAVWSDSERPYAGLPDELKPFHFYFADKGHVILALMSCHAQKKPPEPQRLEFPVPVRAFLKSSWQWAEDGSYLITDLAYDNMLGVLYDEADIEF